MLKIVSIIGARPQFIKAAALSRAIREFNKKSIGSHCKFKEILIHTGQHYDYNMNGVFFKELDLKKPDYNLNVGSHSQAKQTGLMLERMERVLNKEKPNLVLVYGDTNSTLAGALAAKKMHILVAHVEAGLRSQNRAMPEEINRIVVDRISDILFCPSKNAIKNLSLEGIKNSQTRKFPKVFLVGDVMCDSVLFYLNIAKLRSKILKRLSLEPRSYYLTSIHRAENTDNPIRLKLILESLNDIGKNKLPLIFPVHPRTKKVIDMLKIKSSIRSIKIISPVSYLDMLTLEKNATAILTDSGGVQKEAYFLKIPCVTLRNETEWVETIQEGRNVLVGNDKDRLKKALEIFSEDDRRNHYYCRYYGNGKAANKIMKIIHKLFINNTRKY